MKKTNPIDTEGVKRTKNKIGPASRTVSPEPPKVSVTSFLTTYFTLLNETMDNYTLWQTNYEQIRELYSRLDGPLNIKVDDASLDKAVQDIANARKPTVDYGRSREEESSYSY